AIVVDCTSRIELAIADERKQEARQLLRRHGVDLTTPLALLCPGSINSRAKRWPAERYADVADRLEETGMTAALIGSPGELDVSQDVRKYATSSPIVLTGETSVAEAVALTSLAALLVTNDTGAAHIGA